MLWNKLFKIGGVWAFFLVVPIVMYSMKSPPSVEDYVACAAVRVMHKDEAGMTDWLDSAIERASEDGRELSYVDLYPTLDGYVENLLQAEDRNYLMRRYIDRCL